jgi:hypothetical protein
MKGTAQVHQRHAFFSGGYPFPVDLHGLSVEVLGMRQSATL